MEVERSHWPPAYLSAGLKARLHRNLSLASQSPSPAFHLCWRMFLRSLRQVSLKVSSPPCLKRNRPSHSLLSVGETETESELPELSSNEETLADAEIRHNRSDSTFSNATDISTPRESVHPAGKNGFIKRARAVSMHDLTHRFFRNPVVSLWRLDVFR